LNGPAQSADSRSGAIGTLERNAAPVVVGTWTASQRCSVYNLTVPDCPEFFANGVLVHNCYDALRYALKSMFGPGGPVDYDDEDRPVRAYNVLEMVPGAGTAHSPFVTNGNGNGHSNGNGSK
jgi:hypothetical protein